MRERINRLAKGIIDTEAPKIAIQPESLEHAEIDAGGLEKKELYITSQNGLHIKGLAYSSNPRVRVLSASFGGLRNHVMYEIDSEYLEYGDVIEGSFSLVTNGGEFTVPYSFVVQSGVSGRALRKLKEAKDFAALAKQNYETAVQIFEYRDFAGVPFMQDMKVRSLYDGLLGRGNRYGQVEQFMIGLGLKGPVELQAGELRREYAAIERNSRDTIELHRSGWGYLAVNVRVDGSFIRIGKKNFTNDDFTGAVYEFPFELTPAGLHAGRNLGSITFETLNESITVEIEVHQSRPEADAGPGSAMLKRYLELRLDYENNVGDAEKLIEQMLDQAEQLRMTCGQSARLSLLEAELNLLAVREERAREALAECQDEIFENRQSRPDLYCLYQYVSLCLDPDMERWESLGRLSRKYMEDGRGEYLLFYVFSRCEEKYCFENPADVLVRMKVLYGRGCHSPFLYTQALSILNDAPQLMLGIGAFETQVLYFGARRGLVREELAVKAAMMAVTNRNYQPLQCRVLKTLYEKFPKKELLASICSQMIRGDCRQEKDFGWYEKALSEKISLTRLYEYFLYSLPKDYGKLMPDEVLRYFSYDHNLDQNSRAVLYANMIRYMDRESKVYQDYQKAMGAFAVEQVLKGRIGRNLAVIYDAMIFPDMVDQPVAQILPSILNSCRIACADKRMRNVVVCYEELTDQGVYPIRDGVSYVPVYFDGSRLLFEDAYGNRYTNVEHEETPVMYKPELEKRCFEVYPEHAMLLLGACRKAGEKDEPDAEDIRIIDRALTRLKLHPLYSKELIGRIIAYYLRGQAADVEDAEQLNIKPLLSADKEIITRKQRSDMCQALIGHGYIREAYGMLRKYFCEVPPEKLRRLCSRMILNELFDEDELLLKLAYSVFDEDKADSVILDYLCEHYNGSTDQMYRLLLRGVADKVETYDLEERLLAQMLFTDQTDRIDRVFGLYMERKKTSESIVKAYFTMKSTQYFMEDRPAGEDVFRYLEGMIHGAIEKEKLSAIYLLALTKYYAGLTQLDAEQTELCQAIVDILLAEGMVFAHFKPLAAHVRIPQEITDKAILQYIGTKDSRVDLQVRIRPQEERFYGDDMKRVYQGVFIKQKVLFEGETMEYRIYEHQGDRQVLMKEGSLSCDRKADAGEDSRFRLLNQMAVYMNMKEEAGLRDAMEEYVRKTAAVEGLFGLM